MGPRTLVRKMLLATILAIGAWVAWAVGCAIVGTIIGHLLGGQQPNATLGFTVDGQAILTTWEPPGFVKTVRRSLDGEPIDDPDELVLQDEAWWNTDLPGPRAPRWPAERRQWSVRLRGWASMRPIPTYWYLVQGTEPTNPSYFVGYDAATKAQIGFLGRAGFRTTVPAIEEQFFLKSLYAGDGPFAPTIDASHGIEPGVYEPRRGGAVLIVSDETLYRVDLRHQTVRSVAMPGPVISVGTLSEPTEVPDERKAIYKPRFLARLADHILVLDEEAKTLRQIVLPETIRPFNFTLFATTGENSIAVISRNGAWALPTEIYWITPRGEVRRHEQVALAAGRSPENRLLGRFAVVAVAPIFLPLAITALVTEPRDLQWQALSKASVAEVEPLDFQSALTVSLGEAWPALLLVFLISALAAMVCYRHQRRIGGSAPLYWVVFVFLFGLPGLAGYWLHRRWPPSERCPNCDALVPRDHETCIACAAVFPQPALRGNEIFV